SSRAGHERKAGHSIRPRPRIRVARNADARSIWATSNATWRDASASGMSQECVDEAFTSGAGAVLALVVLPELRVQGLDRPPPGLVLAVPRHGVREPLREIGARPPPERRQLRGVERVAPIVPLTIRDRLDERRGLADQMQDAMREVDVLHLVAAAD